MFAESPDEARKLYEEILNGLMKLRGEELGVEGRLKSMNDVQAGGRLYHVSASGWFLSLLQF